MQPERPDLVRGEHVFVHDVQVFGNVPHPAILLEWRQVDGKWEGLTIAAESFPQGRGWQVRQRWVDASLIQPVEVSPPPEPTADRHPQQPST